MRADGFLPALSLVINFFLVGAGVYVYACLLFQIRSRMAEPELIPVRKFAWPEAIVASILSLFFLTNLLLAISADKVSKMGDEQLIGTAVFLLAMLLAVAGFLRLRRFDLNLLGGFSKMGFFRTAVTAGALMLATYPLIFFADAVTQRFLQSAPERQAIVELFNASGTLRQRILIIVTAVSVAPMVEEFIFRFFLYGVLKQYFGRTIGVVASALLFAAVHAHLPVFFPLFVLGSCFAIAYEWSGSILVSMTMHALFNAVSLTALAFPELVPQ